MNRSGIFLKSKLNYKKLQTNTSVFSVDALQTVLCCDASNNNDVLLTAYARGFKVFQYKQKVGNLLKLCEYASTSGLCNVVEALFYWFEYITAGKMRVLKLALRLNTIERISFFLFVFSGNRNEIVHRITCKIIEVKYINC